MFGDDRIEGIEVHASREYPRAWNYVQIWLRAHGFKYAPTERFYRIKNIEFEQVTSPSPDDYAAFRIDIDEAQALMDELWDCGLRPSQAAGSAGQLDAVKSHLADMRKIVFNKLKIEGD